MIIIGLSILVLVFLSSNSNKWLHSNGQKMFVQIMRWKKLMKRRSWQNYVNSMPRSGPTSEVLPE